MMPFAANSPRKCRRATATLELILVLPVLLLITIGLIEFGVLFGNLQQVALASRVGAERASELADLPLTADGDAVPPEVIEAIRQQLDSSGIGFCSVRLEHNAGGEQVVLLTEDGEPCGCEELTSLPSGELPSGRYVRLTLSVPLSELLPRGITLFGCQLASAEQAFGSTTVFRYEVGEP